MKQQNLNVNDINSFDKDVKFNFDLCTSAVDYAELILQLKIVALSDYISKRDSVICLQADRYAYNLNKKAFETLKDLELYKFKVLTNQL